MNSNSTLRLASYSALAVAAGVLMLMPKSLPSASATAGTDTIDITGTVRDFRSSDSGFVPPAGTPWSHVAGSVDLSLGADYRPMYTGAGFNVSTQWRNSDGEPIPPHLAQETGGLQVGSSFTRDPARTTFDSWESANGPYSLANSSAAPAVTIGARMPKVSAPTDLGPSVGDVLSNGIVLIDENLHCDDFVTDKLTTLNVSGNVTILCEGDFIMNQSSTMNLLPGASLRLYARGAIAINQSSQFNMNTFAPGAVTIYNLGTTTMRISQSSHVVGRIISPNAGLQLDQNDHFYGTFVGKSVVLDQGTGLHIDGSWIPTMCGGEVMDTMGTAGSGSTGAIASAADFTDWFSEALGRNLFATHTITLTRNMSGVYEYMDDEFFPIDGRLFGNEYAGHNYYFTYSFTVEFVHRACEGRFFEFEGADDAWMFVENDLALDLGGIRSGMSQYVEFDRMNLVDGETYRLHFFYAQRNPTQASFGMRTNLDLIRPSDPLAIGSEND